MPPSPPERDAKAAQNLKKLDDAWDDLRRTANTRLPDRLRQANRLISGFRRRVR